MVCLSFGYAGSKGSFAVTFEMYQLGIPSELLW
jgi:hypothetical protein